MEKDTVVSAGVVRSKNDINLSAHNNGNGTYALDEINLKINSEITSSTEILSPFLNAKSSRSKFLLKSKSLPVVATILIFALAGIHIYSRIGNSDLRSVLGQVGYIRTVYADVPVGYSQSSYAPGYSQGSYAPGYSDRKSVG